MRCNTGGCVSEVAETNIWSCPLFEFCEFSVSFDDLFCFVHIVQFVKSRGKSNDQLLAATLALTLFTY